MIVPGDELTEWANLIQQARRFLGPQEPNSEGTQPRMGWDGESLLASAAAPTLLPSARNPDVELLPDARRLRRRPHVDPFSTVTSRKASDPVVPPETPYRLTSDGSSLPVYVTSMHPITVVHKLFGLPLK